MMEQKGGGKNKKKRERETSFVIPLFQYRRSLKGCICELRIDLDEPLSSS